MFKRVEKFNKEIVLIGERMMSLPNLAEHEWLVNVINEEKIELEEAYQKSDYIGYIDALIDNIYFCLGGLVRIGLNADLVEEIFEAIHQCNMAKVKGRKAREVENDSDAIKPENWVSPEEKIIEILEVYRRIKQNNLDCV